MNIAVTGVTGNLGQELCQALWRSGNSVVGLVHAASRQDAHQRLGQAFSKDAERFQEYLPVNLLESDTSIVLRGPIDAVVHVAGNTLFSVKDVNARMLVPVVRLAEQHHTPVYHVSSAFLADDTQVRSSYEADKAAAEATVKHSKTQWAIVRPGILTGHSITGHISTFTGYYMLLRAIIRFAQSSESGIRFPQFRGAANIVPVDAVAAAIVDAVQSGARGILYATNPIPPSADWLIRRSLCMLNVSDRVIFVQDNVADFRQLELTPPEINLLNFVTPFLPYWIDAPPLPSPSLHSLDRVQIDELYISRILAYAQSQPWL
jgi:uncharacterized protein YbjT (DUF2867 family)